MTEFADRPSTDIHAERRLSRRNFLAVPALGAIAYLSGCESGERERKPDRFSDTPSWEQDFARMQDGPLDPKVWAMKRGPEGHNGAGQQIYTDKPENIGVRNGRMVITALEQKMSGRPVTSARAETLGHQHFGFGRLVVRAQMPAGRGTHPAIWMRRVPKPGEGPNEVWGEIDIVEAVGHRPDRIFTNLHTNTTRKSGKGGIITSESKEGTLLDGAADRMVEYAVERTADGIAFFVDGEQAGPLYTPRGNSRQDWPFAADDEFYLIANVAIGDRWAGGLEGVDVATAPWQLQIESMAFYPETK